MLTYIRNDISPIPGTNNMTWLNFSNELLNLAGHPQTFVYIDEHVPVIAGGGLNFLCGTIVPPAMLAPLLPQGNGEKHVVVIAGGNSGRYAQDLYTIGVPGNLIMGSASPSNYPCRDYFNYAIGMAVDHDPLNAFNFEKNRVRPYQNAVHFQHPTYVP